MCVFNIQQCKLSKTNGGKKKNRSAKGVAVTEQPFRERYSKRISLLAPKQVLLMKMPLKQKVTKKKISWQSKMSGLWENYKFRRLRGRSRF